MKVTLRISSLFFGLVLWSATAWAQPANDMCSGAIDLIVYDSEAEAIPVDGDTRNATDGALDNIPVCSANAYRDDVWYKFTFPAVASGNGYIVKLYYNETAADMDSVGLCFIPPVILTQIMNPSFAVTVRPVTSLLLVLMQVKQYMFAYGPLKDLRLTGSLVLEQCA